MKPPSPLRRRLNPFALPSETDIRFSLLLFAGVMLATITGFAITRILSPSFAPPNTIEGIDQAASEGRLGAELLAALGFFALPAAVLLVSACLFWMHPLILRRRSRAQPLQAGLDPEMEAELSLLARRAKLFSPPRVELGPGFSTEGQVYGLPGRYVLRLGGGMRLLMRKGREAFQAIVLHELAHIHNHDVWRAYTAQAVWASAVWISLLPFLLATAWRLLSGQSGGPGAAALRLLDPKFTVVLVQVAVSLVLVSGIRAGLLRARELYADWRAGSWGAGAGLAKVLQLTAGARHSRWTDWLRLHPPVAERLAVLADPSQLFEMRTDLPFLVGVLVAWTLSGMTLMLPTGMAGLQALGVLFPGLELMIVLLQAAAILFGFSVVAYLAGSLGLQVQRRTLLDLLDGRVGLREYLGLLWPAFLAALGMGIGYWVIPFGDVNFQSWPGVRVSLLMLVLAWLLSWLGLVYARFTALRVLGGRVGAAEPKWSRRFLNLALAVVMGLLYLYFEIWHYCNVFSMEAAGNPICESTTSSAMAVLGIYALLFLGTAIALAVKRLVLPPRCPQCGAVLKASVLVGARHSTCGGSLSEWLYVPKGSAQDQAVPEESAGLPARAEG